MSVPNLFLWFFLHIGRLYLGLGLGLGLFGQLSLCIFMKKSSVSKSQVGHFILAFASLITSLSGLCSMWYF
jgi:hypothetical protein